GSHMLCCFSGMKHLVTLLLLLNGFFCFVLFCDTKCTRQSLLIQKFVKLIMKGRQCLLLLAGQEPVCIIVPVTMHMLQWLIQMSLSKHGFPCIFSTKMPGQYKTSFLYQGVRLKTSLPLALSARRTPSLQQLVVSTLGDSPPQNYGNLT
ncbi:unnamed protein product, partial [Bubo scandiacus]